MKHILKSVSAACAPLLVGAVPAAHAQPGVVSKVNPDCGANKGAASSYWTPERFKAAKPLPMPVVKPGTDIQSKDTPGTKPSGQSVSSDAQAPSEEPIPAVEQLYAPGSGAASPEPLDKRR